jgi:hypothetical protein
MPITVSSTPFINKRFTIPKNNEQKDYMSAVFPPLFLNIKKASRRLMTFCAAPIARHRCVNTRLDAMMPSMKMENGHVQHAMCIVHTAITKGKLPYSHSNQSSTT